LQYIIISSALKRSLKRARRGEKAGLALQNALLLEVVHELFILVDYGVKVGELLEGVMAEDFL